jgi:hypothetical protein
MYLEDIEQSRRMLNLRIKIYSYVPYNIADKQFILLIAFRNMAIEMPCSMSMVTALQVGLDNMDTPDTLAEFSTTSRTAVLVELIANGFQGCGLILHQLPRAQGAQFLVSGTPGKQGVEKR